MPLREVVGKFEQRFKCFKNRKLILDRTENFKLFSKNYLSERFCADSNESLKSIARDYEYFITGSDQVWHPHANIGREDLFFLCFAPPEKRISYAASFGVNDLSNGYCEYRKMITPWLSELKAISVREFSGADIVRQLTGKNAEVVLDPTLLLTKDKWLSIAKKSHISTQKYILTYFLGEMSKEAVQQISNISKHCKIQIINLCDMNDAHTFKACPQTFLGLIDSAEALFTDSFHGLAFSILMETPFVIYKRNEISDTYSRIETLLKMVNLNKRKAQLIENLDEVFNVDFNSVRSLLENKRIKSYDYLKKALS